MSYEESVYFVSDAESVSLGCVVIHHIAGVPQYAARQGQWLYGLNVLAKLYLLICPSRPGWLMSLVCHALSCLTAGSGIIR